MDSWLVLGPTALAGAGLLVLAGVPKVADPGDLVRALRATGLRIHPLLVRGFALVEVVAGVAAVALPSRPSLAVVALLHAGFTGFVILALRRGGVVASCGCLGRADTPPTRAHAATTGLLALAAGGLAVPAPVDPWWSAGTASVVVTVLLAGFIGFLAWQVIAVLPSTTPPPSAPQEGPDVTALLTTLVVAELVVLVLLSFLVLGLLRSHALILKSLHDLGAGLELDRQVEQERAGEGGSPGPVPVELERGVVTPGRTGDATAPQIIGADLDGAERSVDLGGRTLLAFLTTGCSVCAGFWSEFRSAVDVPGGGRLLVVTKGDDEESLSALAKVAGPGLDVVRSGPAWGDYDIPGSPYFVYVDAGRVIGEGSATTWAQVSDLMAQALGDDEHRVAVADGYVDRGDRDDPTSVDAELLAAGIGPDHPSLRPPPRPGVDAPGHEHG